MQRRVLWLAVMAMSCGLPGLGGGGGSRLGETCSKSDDCSRGRCINLVCTLTGECSSDADCAGFSLGGQCTSGLCGCSTDADCSSAFSETGQALSFCRRFRGSSGTTSGSCELPQDTTPYSPVRGDSLQGAWCGNDGFVDLCCMWGDTCSRANSACVAGGPTYNAYRAAKGAACGTEQWMSGVQTVHCEGGDPCLDSAGRLCQRP